MTISNEPERHDQLKHLLDEQRAAAEQPNAAAVLEAFGGFTLTANGVRELAEATGETLGQVEQAARRHGVTVEPQDDDENEAQLDATMREQMAQWPDDTLALITVGELRDALRKAHDHGSGLDETEDCDAFLDRLVRDLPVPAEEARAVDVRAMAFAEMRAACGCLRIEGETRHAPACPLPNAGRPDNPGEAVGQYRVTYRDGSSEILPLTSRRAELIGFHSQVVQVENIGATAPLPNVGRPSSFDNPGSAYAGVLGYDAEHRAIIPSSTDRLVRLSTRHPEPEDCKGDEYGTWVALGGMLRSYLDEAPGPLTAEDIRVLAAQYNVSPFAVLDLLDKRGIAHEPDPALVPEGSEVR